MVAAQVAAPTQDDYRRAGAVVGTISPELTAITRQREQVMPLILALLLDASPQIAAKLIAACRDPNEPAAIVSSASLGQQTTAVTTLAKLGQAAADADTPAILVIGENVRLAEGLDWLGAITKGRVLDPDPLKRNRLSDAG